MLVYWAERALGCANVALCHSPVVGNSGAGKRVPGGNGAAAEGLRRQAQTRLTRKSAFTVTSRHMRCLAEKGERAAEI